ncbi:MAG TPA: TIM barrel protein, partial [Acetobacteraceae bacterium]|nr:TIM barrel protein [Acetobacteraceae bacterium]
ARVVHVHCKDVRRDVLDRAIRQDMGFLDAIVGGVFTVPGDGCIAFTPLLRTLHEADYAGWLVVEAEQDPRKAHPLTYARLGYHNLLAAAKEAGFDLPCHCEERSDEAISTGTAQ